MVCFRGAHYYTIVRNREKSSLLSYSTPDWVRLDDERTHTYKDWNEVVIECLQYNVLPTILLFN